MRTSAASTRRKRDAMLMGSTPPPPASQPRVARVRGSARLRGELRVPGDKSISHRALMLAALADGESRITHILQSADVHSTAGVLRSWGVNVPELSSDFVIRGVGRTGLREAPRDLDCGNSG